MSFDREFAELAAKLARVQADMTPRQLSPAEEHELGEIHDRAAHVFALNCKPLPQYTNQTPEQYRRQICDVLKVNSSMRTHDLSKEPLPVFEQSEARIYADAKRNYLKPVDLEPGKLRKVEYQDERGKRIVEWACGRGGSAFREVYAGCIREGNRVQFMYEGQPLNPPV